MADTGERTLVLIKPDGVQRGLVGEILGRFEKKGLHLVGLKLLTIDTAMAEKHYAEHAGKAFFPSLIQFITAGPVVAMVWEGPDVVGIVRGMMGATNPVQAAPGTVRGELAISMGMNLIHGSDAASTATREIDLFFGPEELCSWKAALSDWLV